MSKTLHVFHKKKFCKNNSYTKAYSNGLLRLYSGLK